jgi:NTP pyrophosphatase (non-canonical NTP hydrolase)
MRIKDLVIEAHNNAKAKGWWVKPKTFGDLIALIDAESSEALEEHRNHHVPTETYYSGKFRNIEFTSEIKDEIFTGTYDIHEETVDYEIMCSKPEGIPSELADIVIRVFDMCGRYGIDLEAAIKEKMEYNTTRPHRHGGKKL